MRIGNFLRLFGLTPQTKKTLFPVNGAYPTKSQDKSVDLVFHDHYGHIPIEWPVGYKEPKYSGREIPEWVMSVIGSTQRVLDTGCAAGHKSQVIASHGNDVYGIDVWPEGVKHANRKGIKTFRVDLNVDRLPFENGFFDVIFSSDVIEHLFDFHHYLSECHRVLKLGGIIVLITPNRFNLGNRLRMLWGSFEWKFNDIRMWSPKLIERALSEIGFRVELEPLMRKRGLPKFLVNLMNSIAVVARKT